MIVPATEKAVVAAAKLLQSGLLVGMPTETVYGIAADALNVEAVHATFDAKGRPSDNPLIVHVASQEQAKELVLEFPPDAEVLASRFWPGPLTMVLTKGRSVPGEVTAGLDTVAVRMPNHPVALRLIELAGTPVSAPSANKFMSLSPTTAQMIAPDIERHLAMILDGGACKVGIESTVLDLTHLEPTILRPGDIGRDQIERALGKPVRSSSSDARRSPGMYPRHYAPRARVQIVERVAADQPGLVIRGPATPGQVQMQDNAQEYAAELYRSLQELDAKRPAVIYVEAPPDDEQWHAVWDRLKKAAHPLKGTS